MATPRGNLSFLASGPEFSIAASVPTLAEQIRFCANASVVWTDQPTTLASALTASNGMLWSPVMGPLELTSIPTLFRVRDLGGGALVTVSFYEGSDLGI